jgi:hypothetical protein
VPFERKLQNSGFTTSQLDFFTPKSMTMASAGAIQGEYLPNGGV